MFTRNHFKSTWITVAYFGFPDLGWLIGCWNFQFFGGINRFIERMRHGEPSFFHFSDDLKFRQCPVEEQWLEAVGHSAHCRTEVGVVVISVKYSIQISLLIYKNVTVHSKCAFRGKQSVYMQIWGEIFLYVIFFLCNILLSSNIQLFNLKL